MDRFAITNAMLTRSPINVIGVPLSGAAHKMGATQVGIMGYIMGVALEDGSGYCLLVDVMPLHGGETFKVFVRTTR